MADIDIEKLAREADRLVLRRWNAAPEMESIVNRSSPDWLQIYTALVLEEEATKAESSVAEFGVNSEWTHGYVEGVKDCASGMRTIAEGLKK